MAERFTEQTVYTTADGKQFADKKLAEEHANELEAREHGEDLFKYVEKHAVATFGDDYRGLGGYIGVGGDQGVLIMIDDKVIEWATVYCDKYNLNEVIDHKGEAGFFVYNSLSDVWFEGTADQILYDMRNDLQAITDWKKAAEPRQKKRYTFHYAVHYGTEITVDANSEEEALDKANARAGEIYIEDMTFADGDLDLIDVKEEAHDESSILPDSWTLAVVLAIEDTCTDIYNTDTGDYDGDFRDRQEAMTEAEKWAKENEALFHDLCQTRGDRFTSDREWQALGYVLRSLMLVDF